MQRPKAKRSRIVRRLAGAAVLASLFVALLPVWFPWALKPVLNHYGFRYEQYERKSYSRFALHGVTAGWKDTKLGIQRFECVLPTAWIWKKFNGGTNQSPFFRLAEGELRIVLRTKSEAERYVGMDETLNHVVRVATILERFAPVSELTNSRVVVGSYLVSVSQAEWRDRKLQATVGLPSLPGEVSLAGELKRAKAFNLTLGSATYDLATRADFSNTGAGWEANGVARWLTNQATFAATFPTNGWWPVQGQFEAAQLKIPAEQLHLRGFKTVTAAMMVTAATNHFHLNIAGLAQPTAAFTNDGFSEAKFTLVADGDTESVTVRELQVEAPWLRVELMNVIGLTWRGELLAEPAQFQIAANLSKLPGASLMGIVAGRAWVEQQAGQLPAMRFNLAATNLGVAELEAQNIGLTGDFIFPELKVSDFNANFADGSKFSMHGAFDVRRQELLPSEWKFSGRYLNKFLSTAKYDELTSAGKIQGPVTNLTHNGELTIKDFKTSRLKPLEAQARWTGENLRLESVEVELTAGDTMLSVAGSMDLSDIDQWRVATTLTNISLLQAKEPWLTLQKPCAVYFHADPNAGERNWSLAVDSLELTGTNRQLSLAANMSFPARGEVKVALTNLAVNDLANFWTSGLPDVSIAALVADARWEDGPMRATVLVTATMTNRDGQHFSWGADVGIDEAMAVRQLYVETGFVPTLSVTGSIPVKIIPTRTDGWLAWDDAKRLALMGRWENQNSGDLNFPLGERGEVRIARPELNFQITGTPRAPEGTLDLTAQTISWPAISNRLALPTIKDFQLHVELSPARIELNTLTAKLDGQRIAASGTWPFPEGEWKKFWAEKRLPDWSQAAGHLELEGAQLADLANYLPRIVSPEGQLSAKLELKPGKQLNGIVALTNAATRALGQLSPLREVRALVRFDQKRATLEDFRGQVGGQPVRADGFVAIPVGRALEYEVNLHGTNVPLARGRELLLRGDFDLRLRGASNGTPSVTGGVKLHDGLYVQHASAQVWSGPKRTKLQPPYFSITNATVADWQLDVTVAGDRVLRVRTPVFSGLLSANMKVAGSLRQPTLTGDVRANSGRVIFPFGSLDLQEGYANFSGNDPRGPDLQISAVGRNYRYDVRLEIKGPSDTAAVTFSATPPLTSEQVLLMLTAGELPQTDYEFSAEARAGRLATFLGRDLLSRYLGSDRDEERLIIRSGEDISEEGRVTYSVEYRLTKRWSVIGEYDEYNAFNTDLKWKLFTR
jgi:translocation and assembly module TamB